MTYETITIEPIAGALGAIVRGPDLSQPLDQQCFAEIHDAFLKNLVIFFEDQDLTPDQLLAFAQRFGPIVNYPFVKDMDGHPGITEIIKVGGAYHGWSDQLVFGTRIPGTGPYEAAGIPEDGVSDLRIELGKILVRKDHRDAVLA